MIDDYDDICMHDNPSFSIGSSMAKKAAARSQSLIDVHSVVVSEEVHWYTSAVP
jgi:hypothetical protein